MAAEARDRPGYGEGREALLAAAVRVVARGGLRALTYRAVAAEAGVTHGLVAHHFGSRDALVEASLDYALHRSLDLAALVPRSGRVEDYAADLVEMAAEDPDLQSFQFELVLESRRRPEIRDHVERLYDGYRDATRSGLRELGLDDDALADLVFAALDGLVFQQVAFGHEERTSAAVESLREVLRRARG